MTPGPTSRLRRVRITMSGSFKKMGSSCCGRASICSRPHSLPQLHVFWQPVKACNLASMVMVLERMSQVASTGEKILVFDDLRVDKSGQIAKFGGLMDRHSGREGNVRLINGTSEPEFAIAAGQIERWRIVNASSARYVRLSLGGLPFQIIGTDGGFIEAPVTAEEVLLAPGDRVELAVGPFEKEGDVLGIDDLPFNRGTVKKGVE